MVRDYIEDANFIHGIGAYRTDPSTKNLPVSNTHGLLNVTGKVNLSGGASNYTVECWIEYDTGRTFIRHYDVLPNIQWYRWKEVQFI